MQVIFPIVSVMVFLGEKYFFGGEMTEIDGWNDGY